MDSKKLSKKMSAHGLISQSLGLQGSYLFLKGNLKKVHSIEIERKILIITGLKQSSCIILSFAIEIALKGLLKFRYDNYPKTHDLQKLYKQLNDNDKFEIAKLYRKKTNLNIEDCLEIHKDMFIEFRYLEVDTVKLISNDNVEHALDSIIEFYNLAKDQSSQSSPK